jgi:uncharacterized integral membrane protein (TIGR00698 family)
MTSGTTNRSRKMNALEKNLLGVSVTQVPSLLPGLFGALLLAIASIWLSRFAGETLLGFDKTPISAVMLSILLGLLIGAAVPIPEVLKPGLGFAVVKVLRLGIILLGIRLTVFDVLQLGVYGVPIVLICIASALLLTSAINDRLRLPKRLGALIAVGTSICGVSAILATGPAIGAEDEEVAYAVAVITISGLLATLIYPYVANVIFAGQALKVGLWLGTSVHDTSQVVGAAKVYADVFAAPLALDTATVTKLVRNLLMVVVIPFMAFFFARGSRAEGKKTTITRLLPLFVLGFLAMAVLRSLGDAMINDGGQAYGLWAAAAWESLHAATQALAENLLVVALAGVGLSTNLRSFRGLGIKPFLAGLGAALIVGFVSLIAISLLGNLVTL